MLQLRDGLLQYTSRFGTVTVVNMTIDNYPVADGTWHNVTLVSKHRTLRLLLDGQEVGDELDMAIVHDFMDPYLTSLSIGGIGKDSTLNLYDTPSGELNDQQMNLIRSNHLFFNF
jgi:Laminin G domain